MVHHMNPECDAAMTRLLDALCAWERETGRRSTLVLVPHAQDEKVVIAQDGKPLQIPRGMNPRDIFEIALMARGEG